MATQNFFVTGGTLPPGASSYVARAADAELLTALKNGELCYVLSSRQMGKSSLMVRTARALREQGCTAIQFDLTGIGSNVTPEQWYLGMLCQFGDAANRLDEILDLWDAMQKLSPLQRFVSCMRHIASTLPGAIVIFIDEIDYITLLPFSTDEFFAAIRECHNRKATDDALGRLTFCLLGVAVPTDLIQDAATTPFNVGRRIVLTDFSAEEMAVFANGLTLSSPEMARRVVRRVLYWTGGHPYMTQRICAALAEKGTANRRLVDACVRELFMQETSRDLDPSLAFVERCLIAYSVQQETIISIYNRVLMGEQIPLDEADPVHNRLILSGAIRQQRGLLCIRNRIIANVFGKKWTATQLPRSVIQVQRFVYLRGLRRGLLLSAYTCGVFLVAGLAVLTSRRQAIMSEMRAVADEDRAYRLAYDYRFVAILERINHYGLGPGKRTLEVTSPQPGMPDLRHFEWYYLDKVVHQGHRATDWMPGGPGNIVWNRAGTQFAVSTGTIVRVWDNNLQDFLPHQFTIPNSQMGGSALSPDGKTLAMVRQQGTVQMVNIADGAVVRLIGQDAADEEVRTLAWSPDGSAIAYAGKTGIVRVYSLPAGKALCTLPTAGKVGNRGIWKIVFSGDSRSVAAAGDDGSLRVYDIRSGTQKCELKAHRKYIHSVDISPDGKLAITGGGDAAVCLWDITGPTPRILQRLLGHTSYVYDVSFAPDGKSAASTGWDKSVRIWDLQTGLQKRMIATATDGWAVAFSPDGKQLALGMSSGEVRVYDIGTGLLEHTLEGEAFHALNVRITPDNANITATAAAGAVASYDVRTLQMLYQCKPSPEFSFAGLSDTGELAIRAGKTTCQVLNARNGTVKFTFSTGFATPPSGCAISNDGRLAAAIAGGQLRTWQDGTPVETRPVHLTGTFQHMVLSADSQHLAIYDESGDFSSFNVAKNGTLSAQSLQPVDEKIMDLHYSRDSKFLIAQTGKLIFWDTGTGKVAKRLTELSQEAMPYDTSTDGSRLVYSVRSGITRVWDLTTDQAVLDMPDQISAAAQMAFSMDNRLIAICPNSGFMRLIDTRDTKK